MIIETIEAAPWSLPLREPFTISRASVDSTRAALVRVSLGGHRGLGEAALPLGDPATPADLVAAVAAAHTTLVDKPCENLAGVSACLDPLSLPPTVRSALCMALLDALGGAERRPLYALLGARAACDMETDITVPIAEPSHQAELARGYAARGFTAIKVKVGKELAADRRTVSALAAAAPNVALRFDANEGMSAAEAIALVEHTRAEGLQIDCFEQPCARADHDGMRAVRESGVPVVADEAVASEADLEALLAADAVDGINLKLVKMGGIDRCLRIGRAAQAAGLSLMVGAMIESRLGLTAMAHVVSALGGVRWVDLDTAFLLADDPVVGGMQVDEPRLWLTEAPGLGLAVTESADR